MPRSVAEAAAVLMKRRRVVLMAKFPIKVEQEYAITNHRRGKIALLLDRYPRFRHRAMETEGAAYRRDLSESWKQGAAINAPRKRGRCAIYTHSRGSITSTHRVWDDPARMQSPRAAQDSLRSRPKRAICPPATGWRVPEANNAVR